MPPGTARYTLEPVFSIHKEGANWKKLPPPALDLVLDHLKSVHLGPMSESCSTCYLRDLTSMQVTCKAWFSDAQRIL